MKSYSCGGYHSGQGLAARIAYYEKLGVMRGIIDTILSHMVDLGLKPNDDWNKTYELLNGQTISERHITIVIPTPNDFHEIIRVGYPRFLLLGTTDWDFGLIDMLHIDGSELQVHFMCYNRETRQFDNHYWHTVRETLSLEDTCLLYEYIQDRMNDLIILPLEDKDKYNSTGALGVSE